MQTWRVYYACTPSLSCYLPKHTAGNTADVDRRPRLKSIFFCTYEGHGFGGGGRRWQRVGRSSRGQGNPFFLRYLLLWEAFMVQACRRHNVVLIIFLYRRLTYSSLILFSFPVHQIIAKPPPRTHKRERKIKQTKKACHVPYLNQTP